MEASEPDISCRERRKSGGAAYLADKRSGLSSTWCIFSTHSIFSRYHKRRLYHIMSGTRYLVPVYCTPKLLHGEHQSNASELDAAMVAAARLGRLSLRLHV